MKKIITVIYLCLLYLCLFCDYSYSNELRLIIDNDLFIGTDRHYTHGTYLSWYESVMPYTNFIGTITGKRYAIGQYLYTPSDITSPYLLQDDRPYGGVLYMSKTYYVHSYNRTKSYSFVAGVVGEISLADKTQSFVHEIVNSKKPMGWDNQLNNEMILNLLYQDQHKLICTSYFSLSGNNGVALGNLHSYINLGIMSKFGWNIYSHDIIMIEPLPRRKLSFRDISIYGFVSADNRLVARNMFLDGNLFSESHRVKRNILVSDFSYGLSVMLYNINVTYGITKRSKEFEGQKNNNSFGSISITYIW